jgi:hypothetical protein
VWALLGDVPVPGEGPWGPYRELDGAKTFARIGATEGKHDRAVTLGRDPRAHTFTVVRRYERRTGERLV